MVHERGGKGVRLSHRLGVAASLVLIDHERLVAVHPAECVELAQALRRVLEDLVGDPVDRVGHQLEHLPGAGRLGDRFVVAHWHGPDGTERRSVAQRTLGETS